MVRVMVAGASLSQQTCRRAEPVTSGRRIGRPLTVEPRAADRVLLRVTVAAPALRLLSLLVRALLRRVVPRSLPAAALLVPRPAAASVAAVVVPGFATSATVLSTRVVTSTHCAPSHPLCRRSSRRTGPAAAQTVRQRVMTAGHVSGSSTEIEGGGRSS